ncbi:transglutaminase-like domain-containing protein [Microbulbifer agarilyticus]|uniref:transglutaminase-like domain-containing protein n=1 Tax=Microbulbifer agarilyticus TaxID=260552 RepID=UPI001CD7623D|nr:transglutaminase family protein [Microbulbifer agarilyticus]MCA0901609.1 transglutaminase family protein [Microbulbifer agarilyticus]
MQAYLQHTPIINWQHPDILALAADLKCPSGAKFGTARNSFEFVRDEIRHSGDFALNPVTCRSSDVLREGTGFCFAKSHLLAALLRANDIPVGFSYQRLLLDDASARFCLHGLNSVYLERYGWFRIDARGNKPGITTEFIPPEERLAYVPSVDGERDLPEVYADPLPQVIQLLQSQQSYESVTENLPDV